MTGFDFRFDSTLDEVRGTAFDGRKVSTMLRNSM
jgi:hypothetical protein